MLSHRQGHLNVNRDIFGQLDIKDHLWSLSSLHAEKQETSNTPEMEREKQTQGDHSAFVRHLSSWVWQKSWLLAWQWRLSKRWTRARVWLQRPSIVLRCQESGNDRNFWVWRRGLHLQVFVNERYQGLMTCNSRFPRTGNLWCFLVRLSKPRSIQTEVCKMSLHWTLLVSLAFHLKLDLQIGGPSPISSNSPTREYSNFLYLIFLGHWLNARNLLLSTLVLHQGFLQARGLWNNCPNISPDLQAGAEVFKVQLLNYIRTKL